MTSGERMTAARSTGKTAVTAASAARILGHAVPPLLPAEGLVHVLLVGEAPGPRGADKSGVPFFGDAAGKHLYAALRMLGAIALPPAVDTLRWDGAAFAAAGLRPVAQGVALTNAFDRCPTDDGQHFRAPTSNELDGAPNRARLIRDIRELQERGLAGIVTLGRVATRTVRGALEAATIDTIRLVPLPHPSAQGLLSMAPDRGRGAKLADLQRAWMQTCIDAVMHAGFPGVRA